MSDATTEYAARLNLADAVARIERAQAETRTFVAEHDKRAAEAAKLNRDRFPALALVATLGAIAAIAPTILCTMGH